MIVKFFSWDQPRNAVCSLEGVEKGDLIVADHEWGIFPARVLILDKKLEGEQSEAKVIRKIREGDLEIIKENKTKEKEILLEAKRKVRQYEIPMKIIDVRIGIDGSSAVVAFVADGRVDFRLLVRDLSSMFGKSIRLQQIGSRDEARRIGGVGICGRELCCQKFHGCIKSISTEMARAQLISHRGSDRISGVCGRLMCCLSYEAEQYCEMIKGMPEKGQKVEVGGQKGEVLDLQVLTGKVKVKLIDGTVLTFSKEEVKKIGGLSDKEKES